MASYRINANTHPINYSILINPLIDDQSFQAIVDLEVHVENPVQSLELNAKNLIFHSVKAYSKTNSAQLFARFNHDNDREITTIDFDGNLGAGIWNLYIVYEGSINRQLKGLYKSSFKDKSGRTQNILATHFEPTYARMVFPCFDEPSFKATYSMKIVVDKGLKAISNAPVCEISDSVPDNLKEHFEIESNGKKTVEFKRSVLMSSYLVAFVVGPLNSSAPRQVGKTTIRVWSRSEDKSLFEFALSSAAFAVEFYESYFDIDYPGEKIDLIALPDFPIGAMENMGCITFREDALLIDPDQATRGSMIRVAEIVMHELAHMWFGNLVTMFWWDSLWLKEAFATFMANLCLDLWKQDWTVWTSFAPIRMEAMSQDSIAGTHPIECPVENPKDALAMFDMISYYKGCSILFQLFEFVSNDIFQESIKRFLKKHQWKCASGVDLWQEFETVTKECGINHPIKEMMNDWIYKSGHPVLHVEDTSASNLFKISQSKFSITPDSSDNGVLWRIPVFHKTVQNGIHYQKYFIHDKKESMVYIPSDAEYMTLNADGAGFYRVVYSEALYEYLKTKLEKNVSNIERLNLITDLWMSLLRGNTTLSTYIDFMSHYRKESEPQIWTFLERTVRHLYRLSEKESSTGSFKKFIKEITEFNCNRLGWSSLAGESQTDKELRSIFYAINGLVVEDAETIEHARSLFERVRNNSISIDQELLGVVVRVVARHGDNSIYDQYFDTVQNTTNPQEASRFLYSLAQFKDKSLIDSTIEKCVSGSIRSQDAPHLISRMLDDPVNAPYIWTKLRGNFNAMIEKYPETALRKMCNCLTNLDSDFKTIEEVEQLFSSEILPFGPGTINQFSEKLRSNVAFRDKYKKEFEVLFP